MAGVPNDVETLPKISTGWGGCTSVTDRQTDGRHYSKQCSLIIQYRSLTVSCTCIAINRQTRASVNNIDVLHSKWCSAILQWSKKLCILACKRDHMVRDRDIWFSIQDEIETETLGNYVSRPRCRDRDYIPATTPVRQPICKSWRHSDQHLQDLQHRPICVGRQTLAHVLWEWWVHGANWSVLFAASFRNFYIYCLFFAS